MDTLTKKERSNRMSLIRGKNTNPEILIRKLVRTLGYPYKVNWKKLPGSPDIVFPTRHTVIFVHGCFWHGHSSNCSRTRLPKTRIRFWSTKIIANRARDKSVNRQLRKLNWRIVTVWECQLNRKDDIRKKIQLALQRK